MNPFGLPPATCDFCGGGGEMPSVASSRNNEPAHYCFAFHPECYIRAVGEEKIGKVETCHFCGKPGGLNSMTGAYAFHQECYDREVKNR